MSVRVIIKYAGCLVVVLFLAFLGGCSASDGGGGGDNDPPGRDDNLRVSAPTLPNGANAVRAGARVPVRVTVTNAAGDGVAGVTVTFSTTAGTLSATVVQTNANGIAEVTLRASAQVGSTVVTAAVSGGFRTSATILFVAGPPTQLNLVATPGSVDAQGTATLQATVLDEDDQPVQGETVNFTVVTNSSGGTLSAPSGETDANGQASVDYTAGTAGGTDEIQAEVGSLTVTASIVVRPPPPNPASIELMAAPATVNAGDPATLQATVRDEGDQPLQGVTVNFTMVTNSSGGILRDPSAETDADGQARVVYTAGTAGGTAEVTDEIQAAVGSLAATASIVVRPPGPASIELLVSSPQLDSGGVDSVTLTALVRDSNNNFLPDVPVTFNADSGGIQVTRGITDSTGTAEALLTTSGDKSIRTIIVTARAQTLTSTNTVNVTGTTISLSGSRALVLDESVTFSLLLQDSAGVGIGDETVSLRSTAGNTIPATVVTGPNGDRTFQVTATVSGPDTIQALALGAEGSFDFIVSGDHFVLMVNEDPTPDIELHIPRDVTVHWDKAGVNQVDQPITFFITRGKLCDPGPPVNCGGVSITKNTNATGDVVVTIESTNAGPAVVTAQTATPGGPSAQANVEFVAIDPASLILQATPTTMGVNEQSLVTATIRDDAGNLVKGKTISFSIVDDETNGGIFPSASSTNSSGQASTVYTAGATTSAQDGIIIEACVSNDPPILPGPCDRVALTVARQQLFVTLGTSHLIETPRPTQYAKPYSALVTDANGNPVANVRVELNILATRYQKGVYVPVGVPCVGWGKDVTSTCNQEDINRNGRLDPAPPPCGVGEDVNNNCTLEPGNVATNVPADLTTDATGFAFFDVVYAREFTWVEVELEARVTVAGSEGSSTARFFLPGSADDFNDCTVSPPGQISPFGTATTCASDQ